MKNLIQFLLDNPGAVLTSKKFGDETLIVLRCGVKENAQRIPREAQNPYVEYLQPMVDYMEKNKDY